MTYLTGHYCKARKKRKPCQKTVQRVLHSERYKRRLAKKKMVVREANRKKRVKWLKQRRSRTVTENYWKKVIFLYESQILLGTNNRVIHLAKSTTHIIFVLAQNGR